MKIYEKWKLWWVAPMTRKMRWQSVVVAMFGGFWLSLMIALVWLSYCSPQNELSLVTLLWYVLGGMLFFMLLAYRFPKIILLITFPFSMWGGSLS